MWRPAHGATTRPGPNRPASGYGRALGRPGPRFDEAPGDEPAPAGLPAAAAFGELLVQDGTVGAAGAVGAVEPEVEAPAPVTP